MAQDKVLLNDGTSNILLNDGTSELLLNTETGGVTSQLMLEDGFLLLLENGVDNLLLEQDVAGATVFRAVNLIRSPLVHSMRLSGLARVG